eukprot:scaffold2879_cov269-Prasinococcus_capsulatus_cf.AAC.2
MYKPVTQVEKHRAPTFVSLALRNVADTACVGCPRSARFLQKPAVAHLLPRIDWQDTVRPYLVQEEQAPGRIVAPGLAAHRTRQRWSHTALSSCEE